MPKEKGSYGVSDLLLLGDPLLYQVCDKILHQELTQVKDWVEALAQVMSAIRDRYQFGRGIAAPQLGIMKQLVYIDVDDHPMVMINPVITETSDEMMELWDDCMSFPNLLVRVRRHRQIEVTYQDHDWKWCKATFRDDMSELLQHEIDHLHGTLCTMRAIDQKSFKWRPAPSAKP